MLRVEGVPSGSPAPAGELFALDVLGVLLWRAALLASHVPHHGPTGSAQ